MGETYWQAIVEADEPVSANRSVAERSLPFGSTEPRPARGHGHHRGHERPPFSFLRRARPSADLP